MDNFYPNPTLSFEREVIIDHTSVPELWLKEVSQLCSTNQRRKITHKLVEYLDLITDNHDEYQDNDGNIINFSEVVDIDHMLEIVLKINNETI